MPLAEVRPLPAGQSKLVGRSWPGGDMQAGFIADRLHDAVLEGAFDGAGEMGVVDLNGVGGFIDTDESVKHGLSGDGDFDFVLLRGAAGGGEHGGWEGLPSVTIWWRTRCLAGA